MKVVRYIDDLGRMVAKVVPDETVVTVPEPKDEPKDEPQEEAPVLKKSKKGGKK